MPDMPCPPDDWPRFSALLDEGLCLAEPELEPWLDSLGDADARLRPWLARVLLGVDNAETASFLRLPARATAPFAAGDRVGPYVLVTPLGEGGMSEVWRATRADDGPKRDVALKLPHAAFLNPAFRGRFLRERDVLAALSHPNIGQLYEAGSSTEGHPYLALELVEGVPITEFCRDRAATLAQRVDLVREILSGLSCAHQRLIVHRDIKPSNVLVTPDLQVKLLDFGIAKLLGPQTADNPALTRLERPATPAYAAPEQLAGAAITVAVDIYATGVLLFELCTGSRPLAGAPATDDAPLASARADASACGITERGNLPARLRGDLDAVIARALAPDPAARYPSASAFDDDLARWRAGLPVQARRIGWLTRTHKFVRRNRLGVALGGVLLLSVISGAAGISWQAQRARAQAARATEIKDFMIGLFEAGDPRAGAKRSDTITAAEILSAGADRADAAFANDPETEIDLLVTLGDIFAALNDIPRAQALSRHRLDIARTYYGAADPRVIDSAFEVAGNLDNDYEGRKAILETIRQPILTTYGDRSVLWAVWLAQRAAALRVTHGARGEILADARAAIAIFRGATLDRGQVQQYANALYMISQQQVEAEQYADSIATVEQAHAVQRAGEAENLLGELQYRHALAVRLEKSGRLDEAEAQYATAQTEAEQKIGRQSKWFAAAILKRAELADLRGDVAKAAALFATAGAGANSGPGVAGRTFAAAMVREGRGAEAIHLLEAALEQARKTPPEENMVRRLQGLLGAAYDQAGRTQDARAMLKIARDAWLRDGIPGTVDTLAAQERWAGFLLDEGERAAAAAEFGAVLAAAHGAASAPVALAAAGLARIALGAGRTEDAERLSARAMSTMAAIISEYDVRLRADIMLVRAQVLAAEGLATEARTLATRALTAMERSDSSQSPRLTQARTLLATLRSP
jgi:serine/threonine-protein kinase